MRDQANDLHIVPAIAPQISTDNTPFVSAIIDRKSYESLTFAIATGTLIDANATFAVLLEEGDQADLSDAAAVADGDLIGTETLAGFTFDDDDETRKLGYIGHKRYTRLTITPSGNTGNASGGQ